MTESKEVFKAKLVEFFERHDPEKIFLVSRIADKFSDKQEQVFRHLASNYAEQEGNKIGNDDLLSLIARPHEGAEPV
jgi:hypothetical protein